ncbi:MAG: aspartate-semialdehyde dehydrogenase [Bacteroidales bacterium]|nr:aspartate-semialdehyde dehydrogenase [Bacteroidales bacterium]
MKIAVVGATGLVGSKMLKVMAERNIRPEELLAVASERSVGKFIQSDFGKLQIISMEEAVSRTPGIAIFSAGGSTSKAWAEKFAARGTFVIDNSSAWRLYDHVPLVVPEINGNTITPETKIIANPNCSTIQMVLALAPLHHAFGIKRLVVSTYQSVTGSGMKGMVQLENEMKGLEGEKAYPHPIHLNVIPHGGEFNADCYTSEEQKLIDETRKILGDQNIQVTATVVRVPVFGGHSESVNIEFENEFDINEVKRLLDEMPGLIVRDDPSKNSYPMPLDAEDRDEVFVGRIRRDFSQPKSLNLWVVSDNLRKGAATNAVQIAAYLIQNKLV